MKALILSLVASFCLLLPSVSKAEPILVALESQYRPGTIVIQSRERALYLIVDEESALRYKVAVPKPGKSWAGSAQIEGKFLKPAWSPPAEVKRDNPNIPDYIEGGAANNPMGAAALTLTKSEIAIHGVARSMAKSIGTAASYGCIRMFNEDILDLYSRVEVGTLVVMKR